MEESWDWHTPRAFKTWGERRVDGGMNNIKIDLDFNEKKFKVVERAYCILQFTYRFWGSNSSIYFQASRLHLSLSLLEINSAFGSAITVSC